jgi:hypothetical protein
MPPCSFGAVGPLRQFIRSALTCLAGFVWLTAGIQAQAPAPVPEAAVKAAFVFRFPEFVSWPETALDGGPLSVCLSPGHRFGPAVASQAVPAGSHARPIVVRQLRKGESGRDCHVMYVAESDMVLLERATASPILTIGDHPAFCQRGGIINMLVLDGRVRFEINLEQAKRSGLKIDSQLLRLATRVWGGRS